MCKGPNAGEIVKRITRKIEEEEEKRMAAFEIVAHDEW
jgi:hypothetical protein|tara:strand:+ start:399 stop:512 length:114 start_codon:yes stop_codon:yes gene_type:complete